MPKVYQKREVAEDVLTIARQRFDYIYDTFDRVTVSFSGGKDSTVCVHLAIEAARKAGRLPVNVVFYDEEAIAPDTVDYARKVSLMPEVKFTWLCVPIKHRNAASSHSIWWYPWLEADRALWVRELPPEGVRDDRFYGLGIPDSNHLIHPVEHGNCCVINGMRTQESINRFRAVAMKKGFLSFLSRDQSEGTTGKIRANKHITRAMPIYDWMTHDVWLAPHLFGWQYNRAYDLMLAAGIPIPQQRVAPPFGEQPLVQLWMYKILWGPLWAKMTKRVPGARTAARYGNTSLYGVGDTSDALPAGMTWRDLIFKKISELPAMEAASAAVQIEQILQEHSRKSNRAMPDTDPDPESGLSWKDVAKVALRGDLKGGRKQQAIITAARARQNQGGVRGHKQK